MSIVALSGGRGEATRFAIARRTRWRMLPGRSSQAADFRLEEEVVAHAQSFATSSQRTAPAAMDPAVIRSLSARTSARSSAL